MCTCGHTVTLTLAMVLHYRDPIANVFKFGAPLMSETRMMTHLEGRACPGQCRILGKREPGSELRLGHWHRGDWWYSRTTTRHS